ncbi:MAG: Dabb family protein [Verrucomicrobiae bacterium]|nr:Dabb family protein [Verrucomicrobiae bacterium]NNJ87137.1 Dabb family protein [Akkermansiaceae bacterium]
MIQHVVFFKLKPEVDSHKLEEMIRSTRSMLLKIPEVLSVRSGRNIDTKAEWPFFLSVEVESLEKLRMYIEDPVHLKYVETVIKPNTSARFALDFETDPSKDLKYS